MIGIPGGHLWSSEILVYYTAEYRAKKGNQQQQTNPRGPSYDAESRTRP